MVTPKDKSQESEISILATVKCKTMSGRSTLTYHLGKGGGRRSIYPHLQQHRQRLLQRRMGFPGRHTGHSGEAWRRHFHLTCPGGTLSGQVREHPSVPRGRPVARESHRAGGREKSEVSDERCIVTVSKVQPARQAPSPREEDCQEEVHRQADCEKGRQEEGRRQADCEKGRQEESGTEDDGQKGGQQARQEEGSGEGRRGGRRGQGFGDGIRKHAAAEDVCQGEGRFPEDAHRHAAGDR